MRGSGGKVDGFTIAMGIPGSDLCRFSRLVRRIGRSDLARGSREVRGDRGGAKFRDGRREGTCRRVFGALARVYGDRRRSGIPRNG